MGTMIIVGLVLAWMLLSTIIIIGVAMATSQGSRREFSNTVIDNPEPSPKKVSIRIRPRRDRPTRPRPQWAEQPRGSTKPYR
jgi:hypothetical protein